MTVPFNMYVQKAFLWSLFVLRLKHQIMQFSKKLLKVARTKFQCRRPQEL